MSIDFKRLFNALPSPYMVLDHDLRFVDMNDKYLAVTRRGRAELLDQYVFDAFPETEERLTVFKDAFERALAGEANQLVKQPFSIPVPASEGSGMREVWWTCYHLPVYDTDGRVTAMLQKAEDVTSDVMAERMRDVISQEFGHRVKNILSTITSIARQTARSAGSTQAFVDAFQARIDAMARTHQTLADGAWRRMSLATLLQSQLGPFETQERHATLSGPDVLLSPRQSEVLGMAFHELATNAAKYGAFRDESGQLTVNWSLDPVNGICAIQWIETGVGDVQEPSNTGFGSKIIDRVLPMEMAARVERKFAPSGLLCKIEFTLNDA